MELLKQGTKVEFNVGTLKGTGKIVGLSQIPQAVIGQGYIIEPDILINNEVYNYSHFTCFEINLKEI